MLIIRQEQPADYSAVYTINEQAFGQPNEAELVNALRKRENFIPELSLVVILNDQIIGHILFSEAHVMNFAGKALPTLALAPMAVLPLYQKQGFGTLLMQEGLRRAKSLSFSSVFVLGHSAYYPKFGFRPAAQWHINAPFNVPSSAFMAIELAAEGLKDCAGILRYPEEFGIV